MNLPSAVEAYFKADLTMDEDALKEAFAPDARVRDEGAQYQGIADIQAWWRAAKAKYHPVAEPVEQRGQGDELMVRCRVSGQFAGSPAMLNFAFTLADGKIAALEIG